MKCLRRFFTAALFGLLLLPIAYSDIYKCNTPDGKTVYSGKPCSGNSKPFTLRKETGFSTYTHQQIKNAPASQEAEKPEVDIYITSWCPYCKKAMAFLRSEGIDFNSYDIEKDLDAAQQKRDIDPYYSGVPLAVINGKIIRGFSKRKYVQALSD